MPEFEYGARNHDGEVVSDTVEAVSRTSLAQQLRQQGLLPTSIIEKKQTEGLWQKLSTIFSHVSLVEKLVFIKNLAVTMRAGVSVSKALKVLTKQMPNPYFRKIIENMTHDVESGKSLSESMLVYPKVFSPIFISMVKVGEESGELEKNLDYLAVQISRDYNLIRRTKGALTYPAVVVVTLIIIGYLMFTFVLPRLTEVFEEFDTELPFLTQVIIRTVDIFSHNFILITAGLIFLIASVITWSRTKSGQAAFHKLFLVLPVFGKITKKLNLARFTIIFSGSLLSGMPIVEALRISGETMTNIYYQRAIVEASEKIKIGVDLVVALNKYPDLFTPMVTEMVQAEEETGTIEKVLAEVSSFYETEIDDTIKNLSSIIEPILVIIIGTVVGLLAVGLILPIYNISQNV